MNFQDFFRGFLGPRNSPRHPYEDTDDPINKFKNPPWGDDPDEDDDFDELYSDYRSSDFGMRMFGGDMLEMHRQFERQIHEMMKSFGSFGFGGAFDWSEGLKEDMPRLEEGRRIEGAERYLKTPRGEPSFSRSPPKPDTDLDQRIESDGVGALFKKEPEVERFTPPTSFSRSFTSRVIINKDGRIEERVKEWRSDGKESETIRRRLGNESHSVTTTTEPTGERKQTEELLNMDQDELEQFNKKWSGVSGRLPPPSQQGSQSTQPSGNAGGSLLSSLWSLFS